MARVPARPTPKVLGAGIGWFFVAVRVAQDAASGALEGRLVFGLARGGGGRHPRLAACRSDERSAAPMAVKAHPLYKKRYLAAPTQYYKYCCCYYKYCCCCHYC